MDEVADVREDRDDKLELDDFLMKAGLGGESISSANNPSLFNCSSLLDVSANEESLSGVEERFDVCLFIVLPPEETELSEVIEGEE